MAKGPSIVLLKMRAAVMLDRAIQRVEGNTPIQKERLLGQRVIGLRRCGKYSLIELEKFSLRVHLLMLGSDCINCRKDKPIRLGLGFTDGEEINSYSCSIKFVEQPLDGVDDWRINVLADQSGLALARKKLRALIEALVCDALRDQTGFADVGNVIKNESFFRLRLQPLLLVGAPPPRKLSDLVTQARPYTFEFFEWKRPMQTAASGFGKATRSAVTGCWCTTKTPAHVVAPHYSVVPAIRLQPA